MSIHLGLPKFLRGLDIFRSPEATGIALKRNSFFAPDRPGFALRVAGDERAVGAGGRLGISKDLNLLVDLFLEFVFVDEAVDLHGAEKAIRS